MQAKNQSSVILSIFKRKGGEGKFTKVVDELNNPRYLKISAYLPVDDDLLIVYFKNDWDWCALTNETIIFNRDNVISVVLYSNIKEVKFALKEEYILGVTKKEQFTLLKLVDAQREYIIHIEEGPPFSGIYQVLHFLAGK
jgi:hypothetical protein